MFAALEPLAVLQRALLPVARDEGVAAPPILRAYVTGSSVRVRGTPDLKGRVLGGFSRGTRVEVLEGSMKKLGAR